MSSTIRQVAHRIGKLYQLAFRFRELYENRFEAIVAAFEILLIGTGLAVWLVLHRSPEPSSKMTFWEMPLKGGEFVVFLLLLLLSLSRVFVAMRRTRLGYSYRKLVGMVSDRQPDSIQRLHQQLRGVGWGYAPGLRPGWQDRLGGIAGRIAHQTAGLLSERSWFLRDKKWRAREAESLGEWFKAFPACLWKLPATEEPEAARSSWASGYFSVIVPMTQQSARSIRKGWRATDLAEIEPKAAQVFRAKGAEPAGDLDRLELLAYLHIYVPPVSRRNQDELRLFAASIQHLAFLLRGLYGSREGFDSRWNFTLLCESSNRAMNRVLARLGFKPLKRERDGSSTQEREARSYAGFLLFELNVEKGRGDNDNARDFLLILKSLVSHACPESVPAADAVSDESCDEVAYVKKKRVKNLVARALHR